MRAETTGVHRLRVSARELETHGVGFTSQACSGAALPSHALTGRNFQGTALDAAMCLFPSPSTTTLTPHFASQPRGEAVAFSAATVPAGRVEQQLRVTGVCAAWGCTKRSDGA